MDWFWCLDCKDAIGEIWSRDYAARMGFCCWNCGKAVTEAPSE